MKASFINEDFKKYVSQAVFINSQFVWKKCLAISQGSYNLRSSYMKFRKPDYKTNQTKLFISYFSQNLKYTAESSWGKFEIQLEGSGGRS